MIILGVIFATLLYIASAQDGDFEALELNVTVDNSSALTYPERILVLPSNSSTGRPKLHLVYAEDSARRPLDNRLQEAEEDEAWGVERVLTVAALQYAALHNYSMDNLAHMVNTPVSQMLPANSREVEVEVSYIRRRRAAEELRPLVRKKRTHHRHGGGCMICQMLQRPITINIIKPQPSGCSTCQQPQQPPPCGHPQSPCGHPQPPPPPPVYHPPPPPPPPVYHPPPPPPPPVYHPPPPPPPPVYHPPPPQQCHPCPPPSCNPCAQQPGGHYGGYSQSSAQSQSSAAGWGKK